MTNVLHKYAAFWQAKRPLYQAGDVVLLLLTGGFWVGWLAAELLFVAGGWLENDGTDAYGETESEPMNDDTHAIGEQA